MTEMQPWPSGVPRPADLHTARMEEEPRVYEYISVSWDGSSPSGKTQKYIVTNNKSGATLGRIVWFGRWHQYCFEPSYGTIYSQGCLRDLADFIEFLRGGKKKS